MEQVEREQIERAIASNFQVRKLYLQHRKLESKLDAMSSRTFLTAQEQLEQKRLKRMKLLGKEKMLQLLQQTSGV